MDEEIKSKCTKRSEVATFVIYHCLNFSKHKEMTLKWWNILLNNLKLGQAFTEACPALATEMGCANPAKTVHHPHLQFPHLRHPRLFWEWVSLVQVEAWPGWFWAPAARVQSTLCRFCSCGLNARKSWALHLHQSWSPPVREGGADYYKKRFIFMATNIPTPTGNRVLSRERTL